jgi:hypothetical protein
MTTSRNTAHHLPAAGLCVSAGGWELERRYQAMEEAEPTFPNPYHEEDQDPLAIPLTQRMPFEELEEGDELVGVVTDIWLHHGAQVDFAGHIDG